MFYIYAYLRQDGSPYYIGKGKGKRAWSKHRNEVSKPGKNKIIIMESNLTEVGAFALERFYIRWYGRKDNDSGILRNRTDGGEGRSGSPISENHRKRIIQSNKTRTITKEHRQKISESNRRRKLSEETRLKISQSKLGKKLSDETRMKMSISRTGVKRNQHSKVC